MADPTSVLTDRTRSAGMGLPDGLLIKTAMLSARGVHEEGQCEQEQTEATAACHGVYLAKRGLMGAGTSANR